MQEIWKDVKNYEGLYKISNLGKVKSVKRHGTKGGILKPILIEYLCISATKNNISKKLKIHRLVAEAFIPNPQNLPQVNHIDGNKLNNAVTNLEWVSSKENVRHAIKNNLKNFNYKGKLAKYIIYDKRSNFYYVCIWEEGKNHYIGNYKDYAEAIQTRDEYLKKNNIKLYEKVLQLSKEDERLNSTMGD